MLVLNAVASPEQLPEIKASIPALLASVGFAKGQQYTDYQCRYRQGDRLHHQRLSGEQSIGQSEFLRHYSQVLEAEHLDSGWPSSAFLALVPQRPK